MKTSKNLRTSNGFSHTAQRVYAARLEHVKFVQTEPIDFSKIGDLPFEGELDPYLTEKRIITLDLESLVGISDAHGLEISGRGIKAYYTEEDLDVKDLLDLEWI